MKDENKKSILKNSVLVFLITVFALAIFLVIIAEFDERDLPSIIGTYFLYGGIISTIIAFALINRGSNSRWKGDSAQSKYISDHEYFKKTRAHEKPFERVVWAIIIGSLFISAIGYLINELITGW